MQLRGRSYVNGEPICVTIEGERIARVDPAWPDGDAAAWPWIAPGLFDLQINGHKGVWFCDPKLTAEQVLTVLEAHFAFGITRMCPTLITASFDALAAGVKAIRQACESAEWANKMVPGIHLEGPSISSEDGPRGAHPLSQVRPADWDEFRRLQDISGNRIRLVTLAPETGNAVEFIRQAVASGVTISIGHTAATPEQVTAAIDAGAHPPIDESGAAKLLVTSRALRLRRDRREFFTRYAAIGAYGSAAKHVVAFDRGEALTVATRLPIGLARRGGWGDTSVIVAGRPVTEVFTGQHFDGGTLRLSVLLERYPVALLVPSE